MSAAERKREQARIRQARRRQRARADLMHVDVYLRPDAAWAILEALGAISTDAMDDKATLREGIETLFNSGNYRTAKISVTRD